VRTFIAGTFLEGLRERCIELLGAERLWKLVVDEQDSNIVRFLYPP
jgi:hypothetical protein